MQQTLVGISPLNHLIGSDHVPLGTSPTPLAPPPVTNAKPVLHSTYKTPPPATPVLLVISRKKPHQPAPRVLKDSSRIDPSLLSVSQLPVAHTLTQKAQQTTKCALLDFIHQPKVPQCVSLALLENSATLLALPSVMMLPEVDL